MKILISVLFSGLLTERVLNRAIETSLAWLADGDGLVFVVAGRVVVVVASVSVNVHTDYLL